MQRVFLNKLMHAVDLRRGVDVKHEQQNEIISDIKRLVYIIILLILLKIN